MAINVEEPEVVAALVRGKDYIRHRNQVASVTEADLVFLKKKVVGAYYEIQRVPIERCSEVRYRRRLAPLSTFGGLVLMLVGLATFYFALTGQLRNFSAVIYGIPLIGVGSALVLGIRRHELTFVCGDRVLRWVSTPGRFKQLVPVIEQVSRFASNHGMVLSGFRTAA